MKLKRLVTVGMMAAMLSPMAMAAAADSFDAKQKKAIEVIVKEYLIANPKVLVEVSQALQKQEMVQSQEKAKAAIIANAGSLIVDPLTVSGNPKGTVTLVEFFDYQCGHCKRMEPIVNELVAKNANLRVIYKEFPIFGKSSEFASRAALAAAMQGKYLPMQNALIKETKHLDDALVLAAAQSVGLNMDQLKKDMDSKQVTDALADNRKLADQMHLMGTPAFVVVSTLNGKVNPASQPTFIPGASTEVVLQDLITKAKA